jgi:hypothetical protein
MYYALRAGMGRGRSDLYDEAKAFAQQVLTYFKTNKYNDFVNKFGEARIAGIIGDLEQVELDVFYRVMIDDTIPLDERLRIWHYYANDRIRVQVYDAIRPVIEQQIKRTQLARLSLDELLPAPPGIEEYRAYLEQERLRQQQDQSDRPAVEHR